MLYPLSFFLKKKLIKKGYESLNWTIIAILSTPRVGWLQLATNRHHGAAKLAPFCKPNSLALYASF